MSSPTVQDQEAVTKAEPQHTTDAIESAISKLQNLADIQLKLRKERNSIESLDLLQRMLDGELLSESELTTVKTALKGLSKYAVLHSSYKICLEEAQQARDLINQIINSPFATKQAETTPPPDNGNSSKDNSSKDKDKSKPVEA